MSTLPNPRHPAPWFLTGALVLLAAPVVQGFAGCAAAGPVIEAVAPVVGSIVGLVQAELTKANVPPSDPAYVAAMAGAQAVEAELAGLADAGAAAQAGTQAKLDAILATVRAQSKCPATRKPPPVLTASPAVLPTLTFDAGAPR